MAMPKVEIRNAYFIKLGSEGGEWADECLRNGTVRLGYREMPNELCLNRKWGEVQKFWQERRGNTGAGTRDMNQIRAFCDANESDVFITFANDSMYWCQPSGSLEVLTDKSKVRRTKNGWKNQSLGGNLLDADRLSGHLTKVQMFRGTLCKVDALDYLQRKLNDELLPEVETAEKAYSDLATAVVGLMRRTTWKDFEILVELIFSVSGWRRISKSGGNRKTIDISLELPSTKENAFVQIKADASIAEFRRYMRQFDSMSKYQHMFFAWHSGKISDDEIDDVIKQSDKNVIALTPRRLAEMVINAGLTSWLREKVL